MQSEKKSSHGGARQGSGRKPDPIPKIYVQIRLTVEQWDKLKRLGGSKWVAERLDNIRAR